MLKKPIAFLTLSLSSSSLRARSPFLVSDANRETTTSLFACRSRMTNRDFPKGELVQNNGYTCKLHVPKFYLIDPWLPDYEQLTIPSSLTETFTTILTCLATSRTAGFTLVPSFRQLILRSCCSLFNFSMNVFIWKSCRERVFNLERIMLVSLSALARSSFNSLRFSSSNSLAC